MNTIESKYVVTQDTSALFSALSGKEQLADDFLTSCNNYFNEITDILNNNLDESITVIQFTESEMETQLTTIVTQELLSDNSTFCICIDRFLCKNIEQVYPDRFFRFSITRTVNGDKKPRVGDLSFSEQIEQLMQKIPNISSKKALLIDDGVFTGGTIKDVINYLSGSPYQIQVKKLSDILELKTTVTIN